MAGGAGKDGWIEGGWMARAKDAVSALIVVRGVSSLEVKDEEEQMCKSVQNTRGMTSEVMLWMSWRAMDALAPMGKSCLVKSSLSFASGVAMSASVSSPLTLSSSSGTLLIGGLVNSLNRLVSFCNNLFCARAAPGRPWIGASRGSPTASAQYRRLKVIKSVASS